MFINKIKKSATMQYLDKLTGGPLTIGGMLESMRICDEMSQVVFAKKLGISPTHLCDIEKGRKGVSPERAARFAQILGYSENLFVKLALQASVDKANLKLTVLLAPS
jgi:plasmid maintenance system antidote protein VapI